MKASTPTDDESSTEKTAYVTSNGATSAAANHILLSPVASPSLRLKIMLPSGANDKRSGF